MRVHVQFGNQGKWLHHHSLGPGFKAGGTCAWTLGRLGGKGVQAGWATACISGIERGHRSLAMRWILKFRLDKSTGRVTGEIGVLTNALPVELHFNPHRSVHQNGRIRTCNQSFRSNRSLQHRQMLISHFISQGTPEFGWLRRFQIGVCPGSRSGKASGCVMSPNSSPPAVEM